MTERVKIAGCAPLLAWTPGMPRLYISFSNADSARLFPPSRMVGTFFFPVAGRNEHLRPPPSISLPVPYSDSNIAEDLITTSSQDQEISIFEQGWTHLGHICLRSNSLASMLGRKSLGGGEAGSFNWPIDSETANYKDFLDDLSEKYPWGVDENVKKHVLCWQSKGQKKKKTITTASSVAIESNGAAPTESSTKYLPGPSTKRPTAYKNYKPHKPTSTSGNSVRFASNSGSNQLECTSMALIPVVEATTPPANGKGKNGKRKPTAMVAPDSPSMETGSKKRIIA